MGGINHQKMGGYYWQFFDAVPLFDRLPMISLKLCRVFKHVSCPCFAQSGFGLESMLGEPQEQKNYFERTAK